MREVNLVWMPRAILSFDPSDNTPTPSGAVVGAGDGHRLYALSIAARSFLQVVDPDPAIIEQVQAAGRRWVNDAIKDAASGP